MQKNCRADSFQAVADPNRREILKMLSLKSQNINTIAEKFEMSRPAVSKHIKILQEAGLITIAAAGRERHCQLNKDGFDELKEWFDFFETYWLDKFKALDLYLKKK